MNYFQKMVFLESEMDPLTKDLFKPENDLERILLTKPEFVKGLNWGEPRFGHPEGLVYLHVKEVFNNIDKLQVNGNVRSQLRLIALVHDTFKYIEDKARPRNWNKHHGVLARKFMEQFGIPNTLLNIIELHDEAYYIWLAEHYGQHHLDLAEKCMHKLQSILQDDIQLFYLFFKCDTLTGDKNPSPLQWFEKHVEKIEFIDLK